MKLDHDRVYAGFRYRVHLSAPLWRRVVLRGYRLPARCRAQSGHGFSADGS